jgi:DNA-binding NtrC family response regulator
MRTSVLIIDDEETLSRALNRFLSDQGYDVSVASDPEKGLILLREKAFTLLLVDLMLPGMSGIDVIRRSREIRPELVSVVMTGYGTIASAIDAIRAGAYHFVLKPFDLEDIGALVKKGIEHSRLRDENRSLRRQLKEKSARNIVGQSEEILEVIRLIKKVGDTESTVLVTGESGTGKEIVAQELHNASRRADGPFVAVNCAAIPEGLLESELFGHAKGAFTGAVETKPGKFELADRGTIFLDEIGDMSFKLQVKVLRVLQERHFEPVGSGKTKQVDIRVVAATNQDLIKAVAEKRFREDLYYRLNVIPIHLPPLRERKKDIPLLLKYFLEKFNRENGKKIFGFSKEATEILKNYHWPGNVRELENFVERVVVLKAEGEVQEEEIPAVFRQGNSTAFFSEIVFPEEGLDFRALVGKLESELIARALEKSEGNKNKAAQLLKLNRTTLLEKMRKMKR